MREMGPTEAERGALSCGLFTFSFLCFLGFFNLLLVCPCLLVFCCFLFLFLREMRGGQIRSSQRREIWKCNWRSARSRRTSTTMPILLCSKFTTGLLTLPARVPNGFHDLVAFEQVDDTFRGIGPSEDNRGDILYPSSSMKRVPKEQMQVFFDAD